MSKFLALVLLSFLSACSTVKPAGIRSNFKNTKVDKIGNMALYSTSRFSIQNERFKNIRSLYEAALTKQMLEMGFQIIARKDIESPLSPTEKSALEDGLGLPKSLDLLFEPDQGEFGLEVQVVQKLHQAKTLPGVLLFSEIVYHSQTVCHQSSSQSTSYAKIHNENLPLPSKCIISHFHAKLIDSKTGQAMWNNRILIEHRFEKEFDKSIETAVIEDAIRGVLLGENGIEGLK